ncbi:class I SAM-dependent methyltransferase [Limosilactobacillus sp.]|uniref:class I SAM-dependent methyltransferase n=1 Tax=Limosilactobacillus sp. TaxID=2773925 RepID=UPI003F11440F
MRNRAINVVIIGIIAVVAVISGLFAAFSSHEYWNLLWVALIIAWGGIFAHTISRGHEQILQQLLDQLAPAKDSQMLAFTAGRSEDLQLIARRLQAPGKVTGVASWQQALPVVKQQVAAAHLADRVKLVDSAMTNLPFANQLFDVVIVDVALHNVTPAIQRGRVLQEVARVLKAHGTLVIIDTKYMAEYQQVLANMGIDDLQVVKTGFNGWWGGPWLTTKIMIAKRA